MRDAIDRRGFLKTTGAIGVGIGWSGLCTGSSPAAEASTDASCTKKLGWRLGCNQYTFYHEGLTFHEAVDKVASLGLKVIVGMYGTKLDRHGPDATLSAEMPAANRRELKKRLGDAGVALACCWVGNPHLEGDPRRLFEFAREMGIEVLDGEPPAEALDMLEKLCDEYQMNLGIHNHPQPSPYWKPETLMKLFHGRSKRIGACCDTGHWVRSGLNPVETLQKLQGRIVTLDLKDVSEVGKWGKVVPLGTGKGDIGGMLKELHRQGFRGVFGIEYDQRPADTELAQSIAFFNNTAEELAAVK